MALATEDGLREADVPRRVQRKVLEVRALKRERDAVIDRADLELKRLRKDIRETTDWILDEYPDIGTSFL